MHGLTSWVANFFARHLTILWKFGLAAIVAGMSVATPAARAGDSPVLAQCSQRYEDALRVLAAQRYAGAFACLAALADRGDPQAARMALALVRYRPSLSGDGWSATPAQRQDWQALADDVGVIGVATSTPDDGE